MNRLLLVATLLLGIVGARAQSDLLLLGVGVAPKAKSAPAGYQGPGDITSGAVAFYSAGRAYNAAYAAAQSPLADLVDTATGLAGCTLNVGTNGFANLTATVCVGNTVSVTTFCTVTHVGCSITKLYDQTVSGACSGSCDVIQATLANMPGLTLSAQNSLPCAAGTNNSSMSLQSAGAITSAAPYTITAVGERTGSFTTNQGLTGNLTGVAGRLFFQNLANSVRTNNGTNISLTAADNTFHALLSVASATAPLFAVDSSANISTSSNGTTSMTGHIVVGNEPTGLLSGFVCEVGIWPADLNASYIAMLANMRSSTNGWNF